MAERTWQVKSSDIQAAEGTPLRQIFADGPQSKIASDKICKEIQAIQFSFKVDMR